MFMGLRTAIYYAPDIEETKAWYTKVLGVSPYFDQPFYVGYNIGGYELGLMPDAPVPATPPSGVIVYWDVIDAHTALKHLVDNGSVIREDVQDVGEGILVATVIDPFGNI
ncbi:MAG: VOC family protein, partial [Ignavibacteriae bacterium]|nr:VOC family protein [Ignavibacteriota bacterium]